MDCKCRQMVKGLVGRELVGVLEFFELKIPESVFCLIISWEDYLCFNNDWIMGVRVKFWCTNNENFGEKTVESSVYICFSFMNLLFMHII